MRVVGMITVNWVCKLSEKNDKVNLSCNDSSSNKDRVAWDKVRERKEYR